MGDGFGSLVRSFVFSAVLCGVALRNEPPWKVVLGIGAALAMGAFVWLILSWAAATP